MLRRCLLLSMLLAATTGAADDVPPGETVASPAAVAPAQAAPETMAAAAKPAQSGPAKAEQPDAAPAGGDKALSGMSILGNQEAPKSLVIVPWKSSEMGNPLGLSYPLDDGPQPVDKQVFMRELSYYEIRSGSK